MVIRDIGFSDVRSLSSMLTLFNTKLKNFQDTDIIHACLAELQMEEYARLFIEAGYDLPTVTRMTPEDLTAVGIKKPNHRKRLKAELANLNVPDNLPDYIPVPYLFKTLHSSIDQCIGTYFVLKRF